MTQTLSCIYATPEKAMDVASELRNYPLLANHVYVVTAADAADNSVDAIAAEIAKANVTMAEAQRYAALVQAGGAAVIVQPLFGTALTAMSVMDSHSPIESGVQEDTQTDPTWDQAAPLSSAIGMKVLLDDPTPFATFLNVRSLSAFSLSKALGLSELSNSPAPLSSALGLSTLSDNPAPLSSALGLRTLSDNPTPLSSAIGRPTLSDNPAPLSSAIGRSTLSDNPAPLSSAIGLATLSSNSTPLSDLLNIPVLTKHR